VFLVLDIDDGRAKSELDCFGRLTPAVLMADSSR
jgi:hypothetical protein